MDRQIFKMRALRRFLAGALGCSFAWSAAFAQTPAADEGGDLAPLAAKEEMIRDRFQRFQDRIYALSTELSEIEPENAARLARALQRAGELGLGEKLDQIVELLDDAAMLNQAVDRQGEWLVDADRLLGILLERDGDNEERRQEIERLEAYRQQIGEILQQQQTLRASAADATALERMRAQVDQALKRLDALIEGQQQVAEQSKSASEQSDREKSAAKQEKLAQQAAELAEELRQMGEPKSEESSALQQAREKTKSAGESTKSGSQSMSKAAEGLQQGAPSEAPQQQKHAEEALKKAKQQLEAAQEALGEKQSNEEQAGEQKSLAEKTKQLGDQMQQDGQPGGKGQSGGKSGQQSVQKNVQQAEKEMNDASESLKEEKPDEATPKQDRAIDQLEEAKRELEEQLQQMRKEEREETLRDLEARFRDMLARQRPINDATIELDGIGAANFARADELRLADLTAQQRKLSEDASGCLHILDEEGTTIAFPHVVGQLAEDMGMSADRLAAAKVEVITQTIQREIVETLEQLLDAVQKMQQENEQGQSQSGDPQSGEPPLLPKSAELKLLRASQERVNTRTTTIESSTAEGKESPDAAASALKKLSVRQLECMGIAKEMRDRKTP